MTWSCGCVVLSVCHKVLIYLQSILIFRRVEFLCDTIGRIWGPSLRIVVVVFQLV